MRLSPGGGLLDPAFSHLPLISDYYYYDSYADYDVVFNISLNGMDSLNGTHIKTSFVPTLFNPNCCHYVQTYEIIANATQQTTGTATNVQTGVVYNFDTGLRPFLLLFTMHQPGDVQFFLSACRAFRSRTPNRGLISDVLGIYAATYANSFPGDYIEKRVITKSCDGATTTSDNNCVGSASPSLILSLGAPTLEVYVEPI